MLYLAVTSDELELPICVADTAKELADMLGTTPGCIYSYISREQKGVSNRGKGKRRTYLIRKVEEVVD